MTILYRKRIDCRHHNALRRLHLLLVFGTADDDCIVLVDPTPQIFPHLGVRSGKIEVTTPEPRTLFVIVLDQRQGLRIVHDHKIVFEEVAHAVLVNHLFEDFFLDAGEIDLPSLKRVVHLLGDREEIGCALDDAPLGAQTEVVH